MSETTPRRIGIVGCGAIGAEIARAIDRGDVNASLVAVYDTDSAAASNLAASLGNKPEFLAPEHLVARCDIVVECAAVGAVVPLATLCAGAGVDLMVMSVGGLKPEHFTLFENSAASLYIPSGAVAGVDGIIAYAAVGINSITLTTRKPPAGLKGTPYLAQKDIDLDRIDAPVTVFEGSPAEAIKHFPKNINVSTTLALASAAGDSLKVSIVADPTVATNIHEVRLVSPLGNLFVRLENKPSPSNPKTSALAYLSAIATLKKITSKVKIGT